MMSSMCRFWIIREDGKDRNLALHWDAVLGVIISLMPEIAYNVLTGTQTLISRQIYLPLQSRIRQLLWTCFSISIKYASTISLVTTGFVQS